MDLKYKGMTWVGNVYQKFEAMCLEVEDIMCQETAKYVESQMQNVGASVKKFYSEVVQDLLPPSSVDSTKDEGSTLSLRQTADCGNCKKPKVAFEEDCSKESSVIHHHSLDHTVKSTNQEQNYEVDIKKSSKAGVEAYLVKEKQTPFETSELVTLTGKGSCQALQCDIAPEKNQLLPPTVVNPVGVVKSFEQDENVVGVFRNSSVCTEEGSLNKNSPLAEMSRKIAPSSEGAIQGSSFSKPTNEKHGNESNTPTTIMSPTSPELTTHNLNKKTGIASNNFIDVVHADDICNALSVPSMVPTAVSSVSKVDDTGISTSSGIISDKSNGIDISTASQISLLELSKGGREHCISHSKLDNYISTPEIVTYVKPDDGSSESGKAVDVCELGIRTTEELHMLDESCIIVDSKELPFIPNKAAKKKSYKKKIRNAFGSRMRSTKKQEYEQLAVWCGDVDNQNSGSPRTTGLKLPSHEIGESEWELL